MSQRAEAKGRDRAMKILFQGAGAISVAGAALFTDSHEVVVATRTPTPRPVAAFPRRVSRFDPSRTPSRTPSRSSSQSSHPHPSDHAEPPSNAGLGWSVNDVAATRRVTITDWSGVLEVSDGNGSQSHDRNKSHDRNLHRRHGRRSDHGPWDLIVLTTRPGDLDEAVASAIRKVSPPYVAITSQVEGDLDLTRSMFPGTEVVIFGPAFLSERVDSSESRAPGREVRYWAPAGAPRFLLAGRSSAVSRLSRALGPLVIPVPMAAILVPPAFFIPYVAELSIRGGDWEELKAHLRRPTDAATEAVHAVTGLRVPILQPAAKLILETLEAIVPIDVRAYAPRHFGRHERQTLDMLEAWNTEMRSSEAANTDTGNTDTGITEAANTEAVEPARGLSELVQALRRRVTTEPIA